MVDDQSFGEGEDPASEESSLPSDSPGGSTSESRGTANDPMSERTALLGCFGTLVVIGLLIWGVAAAVGWVRGDNDPNKEGSYAWCADRGMDRENCDATNDLAETFKISPSEAFERFATTTSREGSYEWCSDRGLSRIECDDVNHIADEFGETPTYVYEVLMNTLDVINNG